MGFLIKNIEYLRVYYNSREETGKFWSIDFGPETSEILVGHISITSANIESKVDCDAPRGTPSGWFEIKLCTLRIQAQCAYISSTEEK